MSTGAPVELTVYPDDCDAFGHVNHATYVRLFERARWEMLERGPGMKAFQSQGAWPAVRKVEAEFFQQAAAGDRLRFEMEVERWGETSFTVRQRARKVGGHGVAAELQVVIVAIGRDGTPVLVPTEVGRFLGVRASRHTDASQQFTVRDLVVAADVTGDGPPVLFIHGFPLDRTLWRPVARTLTGWRRIAPDLRGFGLSEAPETGYTMGEYADDLAALQDVVTLAGMHGDVASHEGSPLGDVQRLALGYRLLLCYRSLLRGIVRIHEGSRIGRGDRPGQTSAYQLLYKNSADPPTANDSDLVEHGSVSFPDLLPRPILRRRAWPDWAYTG